MNETQRAYAAFVQREVKERANPYPTGIEAFRAGIEAERARILSELARIMDRRRNSAAHHGGPYSVNFAHVELTSIIGKDEE